MGKKGAEKEEEELDEKAVSKAQQRYFGMLKKCKEEGECADAEMKSKADKMTTKQVDDFAGTKHKGLPAQVKNEDLIQKIKEEVLNMLAEEPAKGKKYSKTVTNPKTGRKKKVSYGAKGYRIAPGTSKGDSYCARSYGIKKGLSKEKQNDPNTPNNLSRKKWKCRGKKSMKEEFTTEEIRMVIEDVIGKLEEAGKCQKGYKTHPTRKTKEMFGKTYRNCVKKENTAPNHDGKAAPFGSGYKKAKNLSKILKNLNEKLSKSQIKKMRDKFNKTGKLPPHLMKLAKLMDKHTEVRNIVVPGLEWMSKLGEGKLTEDKFIAFYKKDKVTITAKSLWDAKKQIIAKLKVPKKDVGLVSVLNKTEYDKQKFRFEQKLRYCTKFIIIMTTTFFNRL